MKIYSNEKKGLIPDTKWKKNALGKGWVLGETINHRNWSRLYSNYTITIMFNDSSNCKWWI